MFGILFFVLFALDVSAYEPYAVVSNTATVENTGSNVNFGSNNSNVQIDNNTKIFSGYGWSDDLGWIAFGTADNPLGPVTVNNTTHAVSGEARVLNTGGDIDFRPSPQGSNVTIDTGGNFSGYAWSSDCGWIDFGNTHAANLVYISPTPEAPSNFIITVESAAILRYTWTDNSTNEAGLRILDGSNNIKVFVASGSTSTSETGLTANTQYTRKVQAYNNGGASTSDASSKYTSVEASAGATWEGITDVSITIHSSNGPSNLSADNSGIYFENTTKGTNSGWIRTNTWASFGLTANTAYNFRITTRNGDGVITTTRDAGSQTTLATSVPSAPTNFSVASAATTQLNYTWTDNSTNEAGLRILDGSNNIKVFVAAGSTSTSETGLTANMQYTRKVQAYNDHGTATSDAVSKYTSIEASVGATWEGISSSSIIAHSINEPSNLGGGDSGIYFENTTFGTNSGWIKTNTWTSSGLAAGTSYVFKITARNGNGTISVTLDAGSKATILEGAAVNTPEASDFNSIKQTMMTANWKANGNPANFEYYCENTTAGTNSGWTTALSWESTGLTQSKSYTFRVKARSSSAQESEWRALGSATTKGASSLEAITVGGTALLSGDIISSTAKISVSVDTSAASVSSLDNVSGIKMLAIDTSTFKLYIDDVLVTDGTHGSYDTYSTSGSITTFDYTPRKALIVGTHKIMIEVKNVDGSVFSGEKLNLIVNDAGERSTSGMSFAYPNPYDPAKGDMKITYTLATDTDTTIYAFDMNGSFVWKNNYVSGTNGGKAGYNEVLWNGINSFNSTLSNGLYLLRVVETGTNKVIGRIRLMVLK